MRSAGWIWVLILAAVLSLSAAPRHRGGSALPAVDDAWGRPAVQVRVPFPFSIITARARQATAALEALE